jgi:hypothetical protein
MPPEITVAIITVVGGIAVAAISAYAIARQTSRKELDEIKKVVILNELKVATLWEIYVEDAIRSAKKTGLVASRSSLRPTSKLTEVLDMKLQEDIRDEALALSAYVSSPYDIAIEIWSNHKKDFVRQSNDADIPVSVMWGSIVVIISNVLEDNGQ